MSMALAPTPVSITDGPRVSQPLPRRVIVPRFSKDFVASTTGLLTVGEMVLSIVVYALSLQSMQSTAAGNVLMALSFSYWLQCVLFILSESLSTRRAVLPSTPYFLTFHVIGSLLFIVVSIAHLVLIARWTGELTEQQHAAYGKINVDLLNAAGAMGLVTGALHLFHVSFIFKAMAA